MTDTPHNPAPFCAHDPRLAWHDASRRRFPWPHHAVDGIVYGLVRAIGGTVSAPARTERCRRAVDVFPALDKFQGDPGRRRFASTT